MSGDDELDPFAEAKESDRDGDVDGAAGDAPLPSEPSEATPAVPPALASRELDLDALDEEEATQLAAAPRDLLATLRELKETTAVTPPAPPPTPSLDAVQVDDLLLGFGEEDPSTALDVDFDPFSMPPEPGDDPEAQSFRVDADAPRSEANEDAATAGDAAEPEDAAGAEERALLLELDAELEGLAPQLPGAPSEGDEGGLFDAAGEDDAAARPAPAGALDAAGAEAPRERSMPPMPAARPPSPVEGEGSSSQTFHVPPPSAFPTEDPEDPPEPLADVPVSGSYDRLPPLGVFRSTRPPAAPAAESDGDAVWLEGSADEVWLDGDEDEVELFVEDDGRDADTDAPGAEHGEGTSGAFEVGGDEEVELAVGDDTPSSAPPRRAIPTSVPPPPPLEESPSTTSTPSPRRPR